MTEEEKAAEAKAQATALEAKAREEALKVKTPEQIEIEQLRAEKNEILVRESNYKAAYLKEVKKNEGTGDEVETNDERVRRIIREEAATNRLNQIDAAEKALLEKTLRENQELRLANQNKTSNISTGAGGSTEQPIVVSTIVTPEQIAAFKAKGWSDKDIERYKRNLQKNSR